MSMVTVEILDDKHCILSEVWMKNKNNEIKMFFKDLNYRFRKKKLLIKYENCEIQLQAAKIKLSHLLMLTILWMYKNKYFNVFMFILENIYNNL